MIIKKLNQSKFILLVGLLPFILMPLLQKELVSKGLVNHDSLILIIIPISLLLILIIDLLRKLILTHPVNQSSN